MAGCASGMRATGCDGSGPEGQIAKPQPGYGGGGAEAFFYENLYYWQGIYIGAADGVPLYA